MLCHKFDQNLANLILHSLQLLRYFETTLGSLPVAVLVVLEALVKSIVEGLKQLKSILLTWEKGLRI